MAEKPELEKQYIPSLDEVSVAYTDILAHNRKHTGFGALFSSVLETVLDHSETQTGSADIYKTVNNKLGEKVVEGDMSGELQDIFHSEVFLRAGLKILPSGSHVTTADGQRVSSNRLEPFVANTELFSDFLAQILITEVQDNTNAELLVDTAGNLSYIISSAFNSYSNDNEVAKEHGIDLKQVGEDALRTWDRVESEYKRLGLSSEALQLQIDGITPELRVYLDSRQGGSVPDEIATEYRVYYEAKRKMRIFSRLEGYVEYWGQDLLTEFVQATDKGYLSPPDSEDFPPARWGIDMNPEELSSRWEDAMNFLDELKQKPNASALRDQIKTNLGASLDIAIESMKQGEKKDEEHYERDLEEWRAHGEQPYKDPRYENLNLMIRRAPAKNEYGYHRNNRLALETARLRFQEL